MSPTELFTPGQASEPSCTHTISRSLQICLVLDNRHTQMNLIRMHLHQPIRQTVATFKLDAIENRLGFITGNTSRTYSTGIFNELQKSATTSTIVLLGRVV